MPRYLIKRNFGHVDDEHMYLRSVRSRELTETEFLEIIWEHSHVTATEEGAILTFCIYDAPNEELVREHAERLGGHTIEAIYEIAGDVRPADFKSK